MNGSQVSSIGSWSSHQSGDRFSATTPAAIVNREPAKLVVRQTNVSIAKLTEWRDRALAGAVRALKEPDAVPKMKLSAAC
jgi:hypothetical protein